MPVRGSPVDPVRPPPPLQLVGLPGAQQHCELGALVARGVPCQPGLHMWLQPTWQHPERGGYEQGLRATSIFSRCHVLWWYLLRKGSTGWH